MVYLTKEEYNKLPFTAIEDVAKFDKLLLKASAVLNNITRHFYVWNSLEEDNEWRSNQFKQAVACQIDYFVNTGQTSTEGLNSAPQNQQIGRVSVSQTSKFSATGKNESKSILSDDVYLYLEGTGLLNRGVGNGA